MREQNHITELRREVLLRVARAFMQSETAGAVRAIPFAMSPKGGEPNRCCIYRDRAILRYRCMAAMGFLPEDENGDDSIPLEDFAARAMTGSPPEQASFIVSALDIACNSCVKSRYVITNICQGCIAHPCMGVCHFGAIQSINGQSQIDTKKCRSCGMCHQACPYFAIVKLSVPCEDVCPVGAIRKPENERAEIDSKKCISCGRCMRACPFGALLQRSEMVDVLRLLRKKTHVTAMVAPAIAGQFSASLPKVFSALKKIGFSEVMEVAAGADITSSRDAEEFVERMKKGGKFMTTSCCPAYILAVRGSIPELAPFVANTRTPMHYTAELAVQKSPGTKTVFIGPCVAKCVEGREDSSVTHVITFEELDAMFNAAGITLEECPEEALSIAPDNGPSGNGRKYAISGGVAAAVSAIVGDRVKIVPVQVNGLTLKGLQQLRSYAAGDCPGNLVEVMACEGGCVGGSGVLGDKVKAARAVEEFSTGKT